MQQGNHGSIHAQLLQRRSLSRFLKLPFQRRHFLRLQLHLGLPALLRGPAHRGFRHLHIPEVAYQPRRLAKGYLGA